MRTPPHLPGWTALAAAVVACAASGAAGPVAVARAAAAVPDPRAVVVATRDSIPAAVLALRRAAFEWRSGRPAGVIDALEGIPFDPFPSFEGADRAAWLLSQAYLATGERGRFERLARAVERGGGTGRYAEAIALERLVVAPAGPDDDAALLRRAGADTTTRVGRDLAGAAILLEATRMLERGGDPRPLLATVPPSSRHAARARHLAGQVALERGDREEGVARLRALLADVPTYADRRNVELALAGDALDRGAWDEAYAWYAGADSARQAAGNELAALLASGDFTALWDAWSVAGPPADEAALRAEVLAAHAARLNDEVTDWTEPPRTGPWVLDGSAPAPAGAAPALAPPSRVERDSVAALAARIAEVAAERDRAARAAAAERDRLADRRRYLEVGAGKTAAEQILLAARAARLDSLEQSLAALLARLEAVRDEATRRVLERGARVLAAARADRLWIASLRRLHVDGPEHGRAVPPPAGLPDPDSLTRAEDALAAAIEAAVGALVADAPGWIARAFDTQWSPHLVDRTRRLGDEARAARARADRLAAAIDAEGEGLATSDLLAALAAREQEARRALDSLTVSHRALSDRVARATIERARAGLEAGREALDYGLAGASYGRSVALAAADSAGGGGDGGESAATTAARARARGHLEAFLDRHPDSFARGEMRFRLADVRLAGARQEFRQAMAAYVAARAAGAADARRLPVLDHAAPLALYRLILAEDAGFPHRDAVLFNAGTILVEGADPAAEAMFDELVRTFPDSPFCQESYLRLADLRFDARRFAEAIPLYERAATGTDARLRVIALYKSAWASFNEDRFLASAAAFRAVLDEYAAARQAGDGAGVPLEVDVEHEAESYLVHAIARAGGAAAFARTFDTGPARPYERRMLLALGQHFREFSLFPQAVAADSLFLVRHPGDPDALLAAERQAETDRRWNPPAEGRPRLLAAAERFVPGGAWARAQESDSVRAEGARFARGAWSTVALHHHAAGVRGGSRDDWREALRLEHRLLETYPEDDDAPRWRLLAGEANVGLGDDAAALSEFAIAAGTGRDSLPEIALRRVVEVRDAAYERARDGRAAPGPDDLARDVLAAGDALLDRVPDHAGAADIRWRQGHLAFAHGWYERAAGAFGHLAADRPRDRRAPDAAALRADALFRLARYDEAGQAFETALASARQAGRDSLARRAEAALPVCAFRLAEAVAHDQPDDHGRQAALFADVAARWPDYEHAPLAQYRAGRASLEGGRRDDAIAALETLVARFPKSEYVRDAELTIAAAEDSARRPTRAAAAYERFARTFRDDPDADEAWLRAADQWAAAGRDAKADSMRLAYLALYPGDEAGAMEILETMARRDLERVGPAYPLSRLLPPPVRRKGERPAFTPLGEYLARAARRPDLASRELVAHVRFLEADEAHAAYAAVRLVQPIQASIAARTKQLEHLIGMHKASAALAVAPWAHASAFRIGEALIEFGDALAASERPRDLRGDDLRAYDEVLAREGRVFHERGEAVWSDLLAQSGPRADDPWLERTRAALWPRLAQRFLFRPEFDDPLVADSSAVALASRADWAAGRHAEAIARLEAARTEPGLSPDQLVALALHYDAADRPDLAAAVLAEARGAGAEAATGSPGVFLRLRGAAPDAASGPAEAALKKGPDRAVNHNNYGITRLRAGDLDGARAAFEKAVELDAALPGPYYNLALLEKFYRFDDGAAARWFARYRERASEDPDGIAAAVGAGTRQAVIEEGAR